MTGRSRSLIVLLLVAGLAGAPTLLAFRQELKEFYWKLLPSSSGPEAHGAGTMRVVPAATPYDRWLERARSWLPIHEGIVIEDISTVPLRPWPRMGESVRGLYLRFADYQVTDGQLLELPAGGQAGPQRHLFEMGVYFLGGPGHTLFFRDGEPPLRVDWQEGSLLAVPLNVGYQHVNDSNGPVRLLAVTSFPFVMNAMNSEDFVFENDFRFTDRFDGSDEFFQRAGPAGDKRVGTSMVPDIDKATLVGNEERGPGATTLRWLMAGNSVLDLHTSAMTPRSRHKAHRHSSDAFLLILGGEGYSLIWPGGDFSRRQRIDWKKYTLFVPPTYWYHQHFNTSGDESRHLAINAPTLVRNLGLRFADQLESDAPEIESEWQRELARRTDGQRPAAR